jgi:2-polyprenyl-3-methyl-5-hydroxy-6-metoxy-1,4-benzoquinol methylase
MTAQITEVPGQDARPAAPVVHCEFCGGRCRPLYEITLGDEVSMLHRCQRCRACRAFPPFADDVVRRHYEREYFRREPDELEKGRRLAADYLSKVEQAAGGRRFTGRCLEIGAGYGFFARAIASRTGARVDVVEPSVACRGFIREQPQHGDVFASVADVPADRRYDDVFCFHVMEHLQECSAFCRSVTALLADRGRLWILTPNAASRSFGITGEHWGWSGRDQHYQFLPQEYPADYWRAQGLALIESCDLVPADHHYPSHWHAWARMHAARMTDRIRRRPGLRSILPRLWRQLFARLAMLAREWPGYHGFTFERRWERFVARRPHDELLLVLEKAAPGPAVCGTRMPS